VVKLPSLDTVCISGRSRVACTGGVVDVLPGGAIVRVLRPGRGGLRSVPRGQVRGFSAAARRRMVERLMAVDFVAVAADGRRSQGGRAFLITLTYPELVSPEVCKADLKAFRKRLGRSAGPFGAVWKLELQKRGVPHYHLAVFFPQLVAWSGVAAVVRSAWRDITGARVVDVQTIHCPGGDSVRLMRYLAKYLGKSWDSQSAWGRVWGVWHPDLIPFVDAVSVPLTRSEVVVFLRYLRRWGRFSPFISSRTISTGGGCAFARPSFYQLLRFLAEDA
jgi:hypothetical protein